MTVKELFVQFGVNFDEQTAQNTKAKLKAVKEYATKVLGAIGVGISIKAIVDQLKKIKTISDAITDVKKQWAAVGKELDRTIGFSETIAAGIKNISNHLLTLFNRLKPKIVNLTTSLGGIDNVIKSILMGATAIASTKAISALVPNMTSGKLKVIAAAIMFIFLLVEDIVYFMQGKGSLIGDLCEKYGVDADGLRDKIKITWESITTAFDNAKQKLKPVFDILKENFDSLKEKLGLKDIDAGDVIETITDKVAVLAQKLSDFIADVDPETLASTLKIIAGIIAGIKLKNLGSGIFSKIGGLVGKLTGVEKKFKKFDFGKSFRNFPDKLMNLAGKIEGFKLPKAVDFKKMFKNLSIFKKLKNIKSVFANTKAGFSLVKETLGGKFKSIGSLGKSAFSKLGTLGKSGLSKLGSIGKTAFGAIGKGAKAAFGFLGVKGIAIVAIIGLIIAAIILLIKNWDKIKEKATEIKEKIVNKFTEIKDGITQKVDETKQKISDKFNSVVSWFKSNWKQLLLLIINPFAGALGLLYNNNEDFRNAVDNLLSNIRERFGEFKDNLKEKVSEWKSGIEEGFESVETWFENLPGRALQWGRDMLQNFINGIKEKFPFLSEAISWITGEVDDNLGHSVPKKGPLKDDNKWMPDFMDNLVSGIRNNRPKLLAILDTITRDMSILGGVQMVGAKTAANVANTSTSKHVTQNVNISNQFNGSDRQQQVDASKAMDKASNDATSEMARALRTAR